jgi:hypothetical protein
LYGYETSSLALREGHRLRVFENRVLRRTFGPEREEVAGGLRRPHNEELHNFYDSSNIIRVIKVKGMRWGVFVARMGAMGIHTKVWSEYPKGRDHSVVIGVDGRLILERILGK